ncbi:MAG: thiamine-phosphate kinase [Robiginitomaculum sp.]|nr:MAG: thiamine-phosphate kinase [Robiginitomaculum sp.]
MGEFEFIANYLAKIAGAEALDLKDDIALWTPPRDTQAVISMDTIVEGVHFPNGKFDAQLAQKLIRVNVSDIIAKGADPIGYFFSLCTSSTITDENLKSFCEGLAKDQAKYGLKLWGGDTTHINGPCVLTLTIIGTVPTHCAVLRSGASVGDILCVTGTIGDAYLGLKCEFGTLAPNATLQTVYHVPQPPYVLRENIRKFASAALDISDGLIADAGHLANASNVGLEIDISAVPLSKHAQEWLIAQENENLARLELATGGDDYQVLMSMSGRQYQLAVSVGMPITKIGCAVERTGVVCHDDQGNTLEITTPGYTHF